ncbi:MAG: nucleotide exchange factor GrpE [Alphaproteobacteria bacterium GM202ARS2]|nr:nucleotide exchange factor GrpE [Alphaproteobacteria bacterium GM202ARS2]
MSEKTPMKDKKKKKTKEGQGAKKAQVAPESRGAELDEVKDKLLRALAENENNRRRFERELSEKVTYAHGEFARPLLSVLDGFRQALVDEAETLTSQDQERLVRSRDMLQALLREMEQAFTQFGIKRIEAKKGDAFDYRLHEAVSESVAEDVAAGHVVAQLRCGYQLHDRLLRPSMVVVCKAEVRDGDETGDKGDEAEKG